MSPSQEVLAQSALISAIYDREDAAAFNAQGLAVYQQSLLASAKRALEISFPSVHQLVGDEFFSQLSLQFLHAHPLTAGDWGEWGEWGYELPSWLASRTDLADYPYLGDCAQLDWLCHQSERASNRPADQRSLQLLAQHDTYQLKIRLCSGVSILPSLYPIVDIWAAHHTVDNETDRLSIAAQSIAEKKPQSALIWRPEWKAKVKEINASEYLFLQHTLADKSIGYTLDALSNTDFSFETWLPHALQNGLLCGIETLTNNTF
jgi:Putative DNA-binding domain